MNQRILSITKIKEGLQNICSLYGIKQVYVVGSYADGTADANSAIDFLIDFGSCQSMDCVTFMVDVEEHLGKKGNFIGMTKDSMKDHKILVYEWERSNK